MSPSTYPCSPSSPARVALHIPHILEAVIAACDMRTLEALTLTTQWLRQATNSVCNDIKGGSVHLQLRDDVVERDLRRARITSRPLNCDRRRFYPSTTVDREQLGTAPAIQAIDLLGASKIDDSVRGLFPNVVRLKASMHWTPEFSSSPTDLINFSYPYFMPPTRCVVAFPLPSDDWDDTWDNSWEKKHSLIRHDIEVLADSKWVFDRAVYHASTSSGWRTWGSEKILMAGGWERNGPAVPHLPPAWHTLFLVQPPTTIEFVNLHLCGLVSRVAAIALHSRKHVPGAHATVVINSCASPHVDDNRQRIQKAHMEKLFCNNVSSHLSHLFNNQNDGVFIRDAVAAIKFISWDAYKASISPRQFELENVQ